MSLIKNYKPDPTGKGYGSFPNLNFGMTPKTPAMTLPNTVIPYDLNKIDYAKSFANWGQNPTAAPVMLETATTPTKFNANYGWLGDMLGVDKETWLNLAGGVDDHGSAIKGDLGSAWDMGTQLFGAWNAQKQLNLMQDQFNWQKQAWETDHANQVALTNADLRDRQRVRNSFDSNSVPVEEYMKQNQVV